jgi:nitric oxide reductase activation protein
MLDFLELEETVGQFWHRLVGRREKASRSFEQLALLLSEKSRP